MEKMLHLSSVKDQATSAGKFEYAELEVKLLIQCELSQMPRSSQTLHCPEIGSPQESHFHCLYPEEAFLFPTTPILSSDILKTFLRVTILISLIAKTDIRSSTHF